MHLSTSDFRWVRLRRRGFCAFELSQELYASFASLLFPFGLKYIFPHGLCLCVLAQLLSINMDNLQPHCSIAHCPLLKFNSFLKLAFPDPTSKYYIQIINKATFVCHDLVVLFYMRFDPRTIQFADFGVICKQSFPKISFSDFFCQGGNYRPFKFEIQFKVPLVACRCSWTEENCSNFYT